MLRKLSWILAASILPASGPVGCSADSGTVYAPTFSEAAFQKIVIGMGSNEVIAALGPPLRIDQQKVSERWSYYQSGVRAQSTNSNLLAKSGTIPIPNIVVSFDRSGAVITQFGLAQDVHGKDRPFIIALLGAPTKTETNIPNTVLNYTLGKHSDSHYVRAILMDESGRVTSKEAFFYRD